MIPVKYIGKRARYVEGAYGSYLVFTRGQTLNLDDEALAQQLLRHPDVYVKGKAKDGEPIPAALPREDATAEDELQNARDTVANLDKEALASYALTNYRMTLDQRHSVAHLRAEVTRLIDQYGLTP